MPLKVCKHCGISFFSYHTRTRFCSRSCNYASKRNRIILNCLYCGRGFETIPSRIKKGYGKFCSTACANAWKIKRVELSPSSDLYYILGAILGDGSVAIGSVCIRGNRYPKYIVKLRVGSRAFAENVWVALKRIHANPMPIRYYQKQYHVEVCSKQLHDYIKHLDLNWLEEQLSSNPEFAKQFIKGFYEAEGCYSEYTRKSRTAPERYLMIANTQLSLILLVQRLLKKLGIGCTGPYEVVDKRSSDWKPCYRLHIGRGSEIRRFFEVVAPCIKLPPNTHHV